MPTAVAIAKIFNTDSCDIYTDVKGYIQQIQIKFPLLKNYLIDIDEEMLELPSTTSKSYATFSSANCYDL